MDIEEHVREIALADFCRFLAACYYQPGPEFAEERLFESMFHAATRSLPELAPAARALGDAYATAGEAALLVDYTRLFIGPTFTLAKPYGSAWMEGERALMDDTTLDVMTFYEAAGFEMDETFRHLPDHIAAELEFLYLLIFREADARRSGNAAETTAAAELRTRFLDQHLGRWIGPFADAVRSGAACLFYRKLADLTECYVLHEHARRQLA